jgi:hypothetical protein
MVFTFDAPKIYSLYRGSMYTAIFGIVDYLPCGLVDNFSSNNHPSNYVIDVDVAFDSQIRNYPLCTKFRCYASRSKSCCSKDRVLIFCV